MNTKTLSTRALSIIDQYIHFRVGTAVFSVPYFNNKITRTRAAMRVVAGKGSPKEIFDETQSLLIENRMDKNTLSGESLKNILVDKNIGIDCSGFAYYVLNAESEELGRGPLDKHISFINCRGLLGKMRCSLRPVENCDVATLADDKNSHVIPLKEVRSGDMITMIGGSEADDREHVLVIHQVEYQNFIPIKIHYSHAIAYPEDGLYGNGVRQGSIEINEIEKTIADQKWVEEGREGEKNRLHSRAKISRTDIRRLNWL